MKKLFLIVLLLVIAAGAVAYFTYNKPHRNTATAASDFVLDAPALFKEFSENEAAANVKYLDKVVKVKGVVKAVETDAEGNTMITLDADNDMFGVICTIPGKEAGNIEMPKQGEMVTLKGVCTGMLMDVVLIRCVLEA